MTNSSDIQVILTETKAASIQKGASKSTPTISLQPSAIFRLHLDHLHKHRDHFKSQLDQSIIYNRQHEHISRLY